jgi:very-short-patch-repair endonuclease/predicted transcriptional regulator of viral defense system
MKRIDLDIRVAEVAATQHALVTFSQAREIGLSPKAIKVRLRSGVWVRVYQGVYRMAGAPQTWDQELMAAALAAGERAAIAGEAAAAFWNIPGFRRGLAFVALPVGMTTRQLPAQLRHSCFLPSHHVTNVRGIPVTTVARTIFDLAGLVRADRCERALDNALGMRLTNVRALSKIVEELGERGRTGTALMRELMDERGEGFVATESELERRFLQFVRAYGLPEPRRQVTLIAGRVDFLFDPGSLIAEIDGRRNHTALLDREADMKRDAKLTAQGLSVMRITSRRLQREPEDVAGDIRAVLRRKAA